MAYLDYDGLKYFKGKLDGEIFANSIIETAEGAIASFDDGSDGLPVRKLEVAVTPSQDLHGYDNPWPDGGGKNLLPMTLAGIKSANTSGTWSGNSYTVNGMTFVVGTDSDDNVTRISFSGTKSGDAALYLAPTGTVANVLTAGTSYIMNGCQSGGGSSSYTLRLVKGNYSSAVDDNGVGVTFSYDSSFTIIYIDIRCAVGSSVSATFYPMIRLATVSDATFAPYSNICPISGWTGANVTRTGKNLLQNKAVTVTIQGVKYTVNDDKSVTAFGTIGGSNYLALTNSTNNINDYSSVIFHKDVAIVASTGTSTQLKYRYTDGTYGTFPTTSFTPEKDIGLVYISYLGASVNETTYPMIRFATESDTTYEAYRGTTIEVTFPAAAGTVYGGTLTKNSDGTGTLVVDRGRINLGSRAWQWMTNLGHFMMSSPITSLKPAGSNTKAINAVCDSYKITWYNNGADYTIFSPAESQNIRIKNPRFEGSSDGAAALKTSLDGVYFVYELVTPVSYTLTAEQLGDVLTTLRGANNIFSDVGDVEVTYTADPKIYIDNSLVQDTVSQFIAPVENGATASQAYAQGKYFLRNNKFCKAKTSIASGATFTLNTNYEETTIGAELYTALNS